MTVSSVTPRVKYNGSGSTGPFSIPFYWLNSSELVVTKTSTTGVESTLAVTTHFTLTGAGTDTGALTLVTTLAVGETLVIERATTQTQAIDLARTFIDPDILEGALDKLTRHAQDLWHQVGRSLRLFKDDTSGQGVYNAGGQKITNLADGTDPTDAATYAQVDAVTGSLQTCIDKAAEASVSADEAAASAALAAGVAAGSDLPNTFALSGDITPSQITSNQDNYNPTGLSTATVLRLSTDATRTLTGLSGGSDGRWIIIHNVGSNQLVLSDDNASSTAANRFSLRADTVVVPDQAILIQYDSTASRWRLLGGTADRVAVGPSAPASPTNGDMWFDNVNNALFVWITPSWLDVSTAYSIGDNQVTNLKLADMAALSVKGNATNATADPSDIAAGSDGDILRRSGTTIGFGAMADNLVSNAKLADMAALTVKGNATNSTADPSDINASADGQVLRRSGTTLGFGTVATTGITDDAVTNAKLANVATQTIKGRATASTGDPEDLTPSQAATIVGLNATDPENRIINGSFDFWQRGTSSSSGGYQTADRWQNSLSGGTVTMSRQSFAVGDTLGKNSPTYFLRQAVSGQSLAAHYAEVYQKIESVKSYAGQTITVLGWARRSSGSGNMAVEGYQNFGTGGSPSASVTTIGVTTVTLTGSWAPFAATMTVPSISGKTLGSNSDDWFGIVFHTSAGSDLNARTNSLGLQTINVDLYGLHVRVGTHTTTACDAYIAPELGPEFIRCQRYYHKTTSDLYSRGVTASGGSLAYMSFYKFPVEMRATPSVSYTTWTNGANMTSASQQSLDAKILTFYGNTTATATAGANGYYPAGISFDAEI